MHDGQIYMVDQRHFRIRRHPLAHCMRRCSPFAIHPIRRFNSNSRIFAKKDLPPNAHRRQFCHRIFANRNTHCLPLARSSAICLCRCGGWCFCRKKNIHDRFKNLKVGGNYTHFFSILAFGMVGCEGRLNAWIAVKTMVHIAIC